MPSEHGQLSGHCDDRDVRTTPGANALIAGSQGPGSLHGHPGRFGQRSSGMSTPLLGNGTIGRRARSGLPHAWIQPKIPDQLGRGRKAADVTDGRHQREGHSCVNARDSQQVAHVPALQRHTRKGPLGGVQFLGDEGQLTQCRLDRLLFVRWKQWHGLLGEPLLAALAEQIASRAAQDQIALKNGVHPIFEPGLLLDEPGPLRDLLPEGPDILTREPDIRQSAARQQPDQRLSVDLIGFDLGLGDRASAPRVRDHHMYYVLLQ